MQFLEEYARLVRNAANEGGSQQAWDPQRYFYSSHTLNLHQPKDYPRIVHGEGFLTRAGRHLFSLS